MLRKEEDSNTKYIGSTVIKQSVCYFPTGYSYLDANWNKDYFTDHFLHDFLIRDTGNYEVDILPQLKQGDSF
ncbi:MAG: hypothetical protein ACXADA_16725 [Candidatus Hodarchaeales archaeon]|jgi:hypothetical protein